MSSPTQIDPRLQYGLPPPHPRPSYTANDALLRVHRHQERPSLGDPHQQPYYLPPAEHARQPTATVLDPDLERVESPLDEHLSPGSGLDIDHSAGNG